MLLQCMPGLFVGSEEDYLNVKTEHPQIDFKFIVHACKEPYHRKFVGYTGRACDKNHPEYLVANRGCEMAVNLVDAKEAKYFDENLMKETVEKICSMIGF